RDRGRLGALHEPRAGARGEGHRFPERRVVARRARVPLARRAAPVPRRADRRRDREDLLRARSQAVRSRARSQPRGGRVLRARAREEPGRSLPDRARVRARDLRPRGDPGDLRRHGRVADRAGGARAPAPAGAAASSQAPASLMATSDSQTPAGGGTLTDAPRVSDLALPPAPSGSAGTKLIAAGAAALTMLIGG